MKYLLEFLYLVLMKQKQKLHQSSVKGELSLKRPKYLKGKFILSQYKNQIKKNFYRNF